MLGVSLGYGWGMLGDDLDEASKTAVHWRDFAGNYD